MLQIGEPPSAEDPVFGAVGDGIADDSQAINRLVSAALQKGQRRAVVNRVYNVPQLGVAAAALIFVGHGALIGHKLRRLVHRPDAAPAGVLPPPRDIVAKHHLRQLHQAVRSGRPGVVVFTGDSMGTIDPSRVSPTASIVGKLALKLQSDNPGASFRFFHRAIGGQAWHDFAGVSRDTSPQWYEPAMARWLDLLRPLRPDVLAINFAANDGFHFRLRDMLAALEEIGNWDPPPDVILSNSQPVCQHQMEEPELSGLLQDGYDYTASFMAGFAKANGLGLLDFRRRYRLLAHGYDPEAIPALRDAAITGSSPEQVPLKLPFEWPTRCLDFGAQLAVDNWQALGGEIQISL